MRHRSTAATAATIILSLASPAHARPDHDDPTCDTLACAAPAGIAAAAPRAARHARVRRLRTIIHPYRAWLAATAWCESTNRWDANTGNGFFGGLQFTPSSWAAVGGRGMPHQASRLEQSYRAVRLLRLQGVRAWPVCGVRAAGLLP